MKAKFKSALFVAVCLASITAFIYLPALLIDVYDNQLVSNAMQDPGGSTVPEQEAIKNPVAKSLYINRNYLSQGSEENSTVPVTDIVMEELVREGIVPSAYGALSTQEAFNGDFCNVSVDAATGKAVKIYYFDENAVNVSELTDRYKGYLGLSVLEDWIDVSQNSTDDKSVKNIYSESAQVYISFSKDFSTDTVRIYAESRAQNVNS